jgi:alanyl-tRNA synthetase
VDFEERGYYSEPDRMEFSSVVRKVESDPDGLNRIWLEQTFFYPESGGQPSDRGTLGGKKVVLVMEDENGVCHHIDGTLAVGETVSGEIEQERRQDHTKQHSGQHLLSRVFLEMYGMQTIGFHLGEDLSTIDLDREIGQEGMKDKVERRVNEIILQDIPITSRVVSRVKYEEIRNSQDEKSRIRSRLPEDVDSVRIVDIEGVDVSSCCGTHCGSVGEIGLLKITGLEKVRNGTRVEFVCGMRALTDYSEKHKLVDRLARIFTTDWRETGGAVEKLVEENRKFRKERSELARELAALRASDMDEPDITIGETGIFVREFEGTDPGELREMVNRIKEVPGRVILFGIRGERPGLIFACSKGVSIDMGSIMGPSAIIMGAKGGGRGDFAQGGGGEPGKLGEALEKAVELIREELQK